MKTVPIALRGSTSTTGGERRRKPERLIVFANTAGDVCCDALADNAGYGYGKAVFDGEKKEEDREKMGGN
jgi:hypothetical protein